MSKKGIGTKEYYFRPWFNCKTKCSCGGTTKFKQWVIKEPEYKKLWKVKCNQCNKEWLQNKVEKL